MLTTTHGKASFTFDSDDDDFPFHGFGINGGGILVAIIAIIAVFGFPVFILFVIFFFRYKTGKHVIVLPNRHLLPGQPLASRVYPRKQNSRFAFTRHQEHLYGYRSFHLPLGQSPANSELELSVYSLHSWVSDNGLSVANNRLKTQMLPGCIRVPIKMKKEPE